MCADILLANTYFLSRDPAEQRVMRPYPPLGLLYLTAALRERGFQVALLDNTFEPDETAFAHALEATGAPVVGLHASVICRASARRMIGLAKRAGRTVLLGGPDPSIAPEDYLDFGADYAIIGEGEETAGELVGMLLGRHAQRPENIAGLAFRAPDGIRRSAPRPQLRDLDQLPLPARDALDFGPYARAWRARHGVFSMHLMTSRGCPFGCKWCSRAPFGRHFRQRSPRHVAEEMRLIKEQYRPDLLWIADDILGVNKRWIAAWAEEVQRLDAAIPFECLSRADLLDEPLVRHFAALGCRRVYIGAESGSQRVLDAMHKGITVEEIYNASRLLHRYGIERAFFLMFGYPPEDMADVAKTVRMVLDIVPEYAGCSVAYPLKGTAFYEEVKDTLPQQHQWAYSNENRPLHRDAYSAAYYGATIHYLNKRLQIARRPWHHPRNLPDWAKAGVLQAQRLALRPIEVRHRQRPEPGTAGV